MHARLVIEYATDGAPLLIADLPSAAQWRGREDDHCGVVVEFMGAGVEKLPRELLRTPYRGRQVRKLASLEEARAFEEKVLAAFQKLHPAAPRHAPQQPAYHEGATHV